MDPPHNNDAEIDAEDDAISLAEYQRLRGVLAVPSDFQVPEDNARVLVQCTSADQRKRDSDSREAETTSGKRRCRDSRSGVASSSGAVSHSATSSNQGVPSMVTRHISPIEGSAEPRVPPYPSDEDRANPGFADFMAAYRAAVPSFLNRASSSSSSVTRAQTIPNDAGLQASSSGIQASTSKVSTGLSQMRLSIRGDLAESCRPTPPAPNVTMASVYPPCRTCGFPSNHAGCTGPPVSNFSYPRSTQLHAIYEFDEHMLLPFHESSEVAALSGRAAELLGRREMALLLATRAFWPRVALVQQNLGPQALYSIWRYIFINRLYRISTDNSLNFVLRDLQERRVLSMLQYLQTLTSALEP